MLKADAFGESQAGWEIRKEELNSLLGGLSYPFDESGSRFSFDSLCRSALDAKRTYRVNQRREFSQWLLVAASAIRVEFVNAQEGAGGLSAEEQMRIMASWAQQLTEMSK